jgi:small subunit ribosomal protein S14
MAKKSIVQREKKREALVKKYNEIRSSLKKSIKTEVSFEKKLDLYCKIQKLPRNSSSSRLF